MIRLSQLCVTLLTIMSVHAHAVADDFQTRVDSAFIRITTTQLGKAICHDILGADSDAIHFHLGVSQEAAARIALSCTTTTEASAWVAPTSYQAIRKFTLSARMPRKYTVAKAAVQSPIESWTEPFSNTTTLLEGPEGLSDARLIQLLSHETAVFFDSKIDLLQPDAQNIPQLRSMKFVSTSMMRPQVALLDPFVANALTYLRALQVEFDIVKELVDRGEIPMPADYNDADLRFRISDRYKALNISHLVDRFREEFLPIASPLLAFSPRFRAVLREELKRLNINWTSEQWPKLQQTIYADPTRFIYDRFKGDALKAIQNVFSAQADDQPRYSDASAFIQEDLWPLERPALEDTTVNGVPLYEAMKTPLLSGYNILLSSGPRARIRAGGSE